MMRHATMRATSTPCTRLSRSPARLTKCRRTPRIVARAQREEKSVHDTVDQGVRQFFSRYDVLSPGLGVMCVTSYCVAKGQDPWTAIGISFAATVLALVLSEAMDEITCNKK